MSQHNLAVADEAIEGEVIDAVVQDTAPIYWRATIQIKVPTTDESINSLFFSIQRIENRLDLHSQSQDKIIELLSVMNTSLYASSSVSTPQDEGMMELLQDVSFKMDALSEAFASLPDWIPAHTLTDSTGLGADAIRKQLQNPKFFEPEVDYKQVGKIWFIHKSAIPKVRRLK